MQGPERAARPDGDYVTMICGASMLVQRRKGDIIMPLAGPGQDHMRGEAKKYAKFAYPRQSELCLEAGQWTHNGSCSADTLAISADGWDWHIR
jgi:hypothetical protein